MQLKQIRFLNCPCLLSNPYNILPPFCYVSQRTAFSRVSYPLACGQVWPEQEVSLLHGMTCSDCLSSFPLAFTVGPSLCGFSSAMEQSLSAKILAPSSQSQLLCPSNSPSIFVSQLYANQQLPVYKSLGYLCLLCFLALGSDMGTYVYV